MVYESIASILLYMAITGCTQPVVFVLIALLILRIRSETITFRDYLNSIKMDTDKTIEELEKRKRELQLRHEIAQLERSERMRGASSKWSSRAASWSWWWVGPLTLAALFWILIALAAPMVPAIVLGIPFLVPVFLKGMNHWHK